MIKYFLLISLLLISFHGYTQTLEENKQQVDCDFLKQINKSHHQQVEQLAFKLKSEIFLQDSVILPEIDSLFNIHEYIQKINRELDLRTDTLDNSVIDISRDADIINETRKLLDYTLVQNDSSLLKTFLLINWDHLIEPCDIDKSQALLYTLNLDVLYRIQNIRPLSTHIKETISYSVSLNNRIIANSGYLEITVSLLGTNIKQQNAVIVFEGKKYLFFNNKVVVKLKTTTEKGKKVKYVKTYSEQLWEKEVQLNLQMISDDGETLIFPIKEKYYISKPYIMVQSSPKWFLYIGCLNEMILMAPSLGADYNPRYEISDPDSNELIPLKFYPFEIGIVPRTKTVKLRIFNDSLLIGEQSFEVRKIPNPDFIFLVDKRSHPCNTISVQKLNNLELIIRDENFYSYYPKDGYFMAKEIEVKLIRDNSVILTEVEGGGVYNSSKPIFSIDSKLLKEALPNDKLVFTIVELKRRTYKKDFIKFDIIPYTKEFILTE